MTKATIGIIGGSGLYELPNIEIVKEHSIETPFGRPSDVITEVNIKGVTAHFLPRHGKGHKFLPSEVNYRANIYALKSLGVTHCISISATGSLQEKFAQGSFVIPDQIIDRTKNRESTFFGNGVVAYPSLADPFCPNLQSALYENLKNLIDSPVHSKVTYLCMEGPALSTRAESHFHRSLGADCIGMTAIPEAKLAREAEIAYASICMITDYDCWKEDESDVSAMRVFEALISMTSLIKSVLPQIIKSCSEVSPSELASKALANSIATDLNQISDENKERLFEILKKYI